MEEVVGTGWQAVGGIQEVVGEVAGRGWQAGVGRQRWQTGKRKAEVSDRGGRYKGVRHGTPLVWPGWKKTVIK